MLRITKDTNEIIVRETLVRKWFAAAIVGALFGGIFCFGFFLLTKFLPCAIGVGAIVFSAAFLVVEWDHPSTTVKINKQGETVSVRKKSLIGYSFTVYSFSEIMDKIYVDESRDSQNSLNYQLILPLKNGEKIELSDWTDNDKRTCFEAMELMNPYIFDTSKQIPSN